ncbi:5554_t:CDS:2 [Cetraspora pellucida]|uniref:5554_t:CDS:1 n=1 Tax=Cetraspora pellucida TaxID=1433469 RepID=A0ACA9M4A0_9GLOM|nr:5554_t:CDS:2 [Cetraspora pellucida]
MSHQLTVNTLRPVYNLVELELDDYEENKLILNTIHDLKLFFKNSNNYTCPLEEHELELFIKSQLMAFAITDEKSNNKTSIKHTYKFNYNNSLPFCKPIYLKLCEINSYLLFTLQSHLQLNRLTKCVYENTEHAFKTELRPHASDLCEVCTSFKAKLLVAKQDIDKYSKVQVEYNEHKKAANLKRQHYNNNVEENNHVNIIDDIKNIIISSSKENDAIQYKDDKGWVCLEIGKVYASKKSGEEENSF